MTCNTAVGPHMSPRTGVHEDAHVTYIGMSPLVENSHEDLLPTLLAELWEGIRSQHRLEEACRGPRLAWNPYRRQQSGSTTRVAVLNSQIVEFASDVETNSLYLRGTAMTIHPAPDLAEGSRPATGDVTWSSSPSSASAVRCYGGVISDKATTDGRAESDAEMEQRLFTCIWNQVVVPFYSSRDHNRPFMKGKTEAQRGRKPAHTRSGAPCNTPSEQARQASLKLLSHMPLSRAPCATQVSAPPTVSKKDAVVAAVRRGQRSVHSVKLAPIQRDKTPTTLQCAPRHRPDVQQGGVLGQRAAPDKRVLAEEPKPSGRARLNSLRGVRSRVACPGITNKESTQRQARRKGESVSQKKVASTEYQDEPT